MHSRVTAAKCLSGNDAGMVYPRLVQYWLLRRPRNSCLGSARPARGWPRLVLRSFDRNPFPNSADARINSLFSKKGIPCSRN